MFLDDLKPHVVVVRGGTDRRHRERSLQSGSSVYHTLRDRFTVIDTQLATSGKFELQGRKVSADDLLSVGGLIFHTLQGRDARRLQQACRDRDIPHTGNAHTAYGEASSLARKDILRKADVSTIPYWRLADNYDVAEDALYGAILDHIRYPVVISPLPDAFSVDALLIENEVELMEVLETCFSLSSPVTISDTYGGNVYSAVVMESFRGESPYVFPPHELLHDREVANMCQPEEAAYRRPEGTPNVEDIEKLARMTFSELHLRDIATVTILETEDKELYILDVEPHPRLDRHSLLSESTDCVGSTLEEALSAVVNQAKARSGQLKKMSHAL